MKFFSFFIANFKIKFNFDFFDTNIFNIFLIFCFIFYVYKASYNFSLEIKQKEISQKIQNSEKNLQQSMNFYFLAEKFYSDSLLTFSDIIYFLKKKKTAILLKKIEDLKKLLLKKKDLTKKVLVKTKINKLFFTKQYLVYLILIKIIKKYLFENSKFKNKILNSILNKLNH